MLTSYYREPASNGGTYGGVAIFVRSDIAEFCEVVKIDNFCQDKIFEAVAIKNKVEKITILTVYRSDGNVLNFTDKLDEIIAGMSGKIIVAGDFNIDFLTNECNNLESCLSSHNLVRHVHVPTRQKACLDNVLSNVECIETKVEDEGKYSDHSMIIFKFALA